MKSMKKLPKHSLFIVSFLNMCFYIFYGLVYRFFYYEWIRNMLKIILSIYTLVILGIFIYSIFNRFQTKKWAFILLWNIALLFMSLYL